MACDVGFWVARDSKRSGFTALGSGFGDSNSELIIYYFSICAVKVIDLVP